MPLETENSAQTPNVSPNYFVGSFPHTLDAKGRVVIPQAFRAGLGNPITIAPSQDFTAICLYENSEWERVHARYDSYGNNSVVKRFLRAYNALCYREQEYDSQGRILIPAKIRKFILGDEKEIEFSGDGNTVRITTSQSFEELLANIREDVPMYEKEMDRLNDLELTKVR